MFSIPRVIACRFTSARASIYAHVCSPTCAILTRRACCASHRSITHIRTAGEIGALLLEAQMIKQQQPLFNQLRRNRQLCAWQLVDGIPAVVYSRDIDCQAPNLYGLYSSRTESAVAALQALADAHRLSYGTLGLEKLVAGKACFRSMLKRCNGVCCGKKVPPTMHSACTQHCKVCALPPGLPWCHRTKEKFEDLQQIHVVHNWCYLGSSTTLAQARKLGKAAAGF